MRGKAESLSADARNPGITPAHAGKRSWSWRQIWSRRDHPRTCGEKRIGDMADTPKIGSPPHMRGKVTPRLIASLEWGITPAHAGKRMQSQTSQALGWDHPPHMRGKVRWKYKSCRKPGSPPHMRGKDTMRELIVKEQRITPAHAGKRLAAIHDQLLFQDHPRTCGEKRQSFR